MFWPCREIGPNGERCALDAGHDGQHIPLPAAPPPGVQPGAATPGGPPPPPAAPLPPTATAPPTAGTPPPAATPPPPVIRAAQPVIPAMTGTPWGGPPKSSGRSPLVWIGLAVIGFLVVGIGAALVLGGGSDPTASLAASMPALVVPGTSATPGMTEPGPSSPSPTTAIRPIGLPGASGTPAATVAPAATAPPPVTPVATPKPLGYGTLSYSSTACFEVDWKDARGRQISGAEARYAITIKNPTGARTRNLWIGIQTTDQFTTDPLISRASWARRPKAFGDETSLVIAGPRLDPGATRLKWRVFYQTPIDVHTRIWIAEGPNPSKGVMTIEEIEAASAYVWDVKTNVKVCR